MLRHLCSNEVMLKLHEVVFVSGESGYGGTEADAYMVTEAPDTSLYNLLHPNRDALGHDHVQWFLSRLLRGLHGMHSAQVYHLDLSVFSVVIFQNCDLRIINIAWELQIPGLSTTDPKPFKCWYKAPELLFDASGWHTTPEGRAAADIWALGCIFAEMLSGRVLFEGRDFYDQLACIVNVLGSPSQEDIEVLANGKGREFLASIQPTGPVSLRSHLPDVADDALDLLEAMLDYHPMRRITPFAALQHPYLEGASEMDLPLGLPAELFDTSFAVEAVTRAPNSVAEGLWAMLREEGVQVDSSFWVT